jgi:hypothetical protein
LRWRRSGSYSNWRCVCSSCSINLFSLHLCFVI